MRTWISDTDPRWVMRCDVPGCPATSEAFDREPPLTLFADRGWFIAPKSGDMCPACLARTGTGAFVGGKVGRS